VSCWPARRAVVFVGTLDSASAKSGPSGAAGIPAKGSVVLGVASMGECVWRSTPLRMLTSAPVGLSRVRPRSLDRHQRGDGDDSMPALRSAHPVVVRSRAHGKSPRVEPRSPVAPPSRRRVQARPGCATDVVHAGSWWRRSRTGHGYAPRCYERRAAPPRPRSPEEGSPSRCSSGFRRHKSVRPRCRRPGIGQPRALNCVTRVMAGEGYPAGTTVSTSCAPPVRCPITPDCRRRPGR